ncbi:MAG: endonuclease/exonuclease/phosphatase family protein [Bdellovibrionales bacterium]|nr:endonuclease/exonuclease/phosphatase family protein [Bdellovibrionales bacterium]
MRFLTFNLWHGLSPTSPVAFEGLEPSERRRLREELQIEVIRQAQPDVCFFQEVNPVVRRAPLIAERLGMDVTYQPDLVGLKLFGLGLPFNLNSGLVIMTSKRFGVKRIEGVSLSRPGLSLVHSWGSWQLKEERFALFSETLLPKWGRVLLVNTHLHHGLESTTEYLDELEKLGRELELSNALMSELKDRLAQGNQRRNQELSVLLRALQRLEKRYEAVVLGGDFNASPASELGQMLREMGFRDVWQESHGSSEPGLTYDHTANQANHKLQSRFPLTMVVEDLSFSTKVKDALMGLARKHENRPRRIDYLWVRSANVELKVKKAEMIGYPNREDLAPSDHFGVIADIEPV